MQTHNVICSDAFVNPATEEFWKLGEKYKRPTLARTLRRIAANGYKEFTEGETGKMLVRELTEMGGIITKEDFMEYRLA